MAFKGVIPAGTVKPSPYGLFSVATVDEKGQSDPHWGMGFSAMSEACTFEAQVIDICGGIEAQDVFVKDGARFQEIRPFGITAADKCLSVGFDVEDRRQRAIRQLELVTQKAVEAELWSGAYRRKYNESLNDVDRQMYLASSDTTVVDDTAQKIAVAMALLEQALADCGPGFEGVIHMSPLVASALGDSLSASDGDEGRTQLRTSTGNLVAVGNGYDGRGPSQDGPESPFVHWIYATGPVHVILGSNEMVTVDATQALDVRTNEMTYVAERPAAVYTDGCCQLAVKTDIRL